MEDQKEIVDELDKAKSFLILKESEAGKYVIDDLKKAKNDLVGSLIGGYGNKSHIELISIIARLESVSNLLDKIMNSEEAVKILKEELK